MRRQDSFPWIIVMGGAVLYWTIALGIGIPSLYRMLGGEGPARRVTGTDHGCITSAAVATEDGKLVSFGDCINVRFMLDTPDLARPHLRVHLPYRSVGAMPVLVGPDPEIKNPVWNPTPLEDPEARQPIGRTSY